MVKTKRVYDPTEASDGERILVTRYWPRPLSKAQVAYSDWLRNLAPSAELLRDSKRKEISWRDYVARYHTEMRGQREAIKTLARKAKCGTITLLCFEEEDDPHCHRYLLRQLIENEERNVE